MRAERFRGDGFQPVSKAARTAALQTNEMLCPYDDCIDTGGYSRPYNQITARDSP
jgi:hypothetical protein